jgi:hypothetical protein
MPGTLTRLGFGGGFYCTPNRVRVGLHPGRGPALPEQLWQELADSGLLPPDSCLES